MNYLNYFHCVPTCGLTLDSPHRETYLGFNINFEYSRKISVKQLVFSSGIM